MKPKEKKPDLAEKLLQKASRSYRRRIRIQAVKDADKEIKEYATQPVQDAIRGNDL